MKRDKEWLRTEMIKNFDEWLSTSNTLRELRGSVIELIDQLVEPERVVIPQFVADDIRELRREGEYWGSTGVGRWLSQEGGWRIQDETQEWLGNLSSDNFKTFFSVWSGVEYEIEKEPLYYVEFVKGKQYLNQYVDGSLKILSKNNTSVYKTQFTESEIKAIDEKYWAFAEPVEGSKTN